MSQGKQMIKSIRFEWLYNAVKLRLCEGLGGFPDNPGIINKTDSQSRNPAPDLKQLSKKKKRQWHESDKKKKRSEVWKINFRCMRSSFF